MITKNIRVSEKGQKEALDIGHQGEYNVRQFIFDLSELQGAAGDGMATLVHYPIDGTPYTVPVVRGETFDLADQDGHTLTWTIGKLATQYAGGGIVAVIWTALDSRVKSRRYKTTCQRAVDQPNHIDAQQSYIDQLATISGDILAGLRDAAEAKEDIETAAGDGLQAIQQAVEDADTKIGEIQTAGNSAVGAVQNAGSAAVGAVQDARSAAVAAAQAAANVTVQDECLIYGGGNG